MHVPDVRRYLLNTPGKRKNGLFKFLKSAITQPYVVVYVWLISNNYCASPCFKRLFQCFNALFIFLICKVC